MARYINLVIGIAICALFYFVTSGGGTFFDIGATGGGGKPNPGARIYHK